MSVRTAQIDDLPQLAGLFNQYRMFYEQASDLETAHQFLAQRLERQDSRLLVSVQDQQLAGFSQLYPSFCSIKAEPLYILSDLFVDPRFRQQGHGTRLMQASRQLAETTGRTRLELTTARTNLTAQALYESKGWQRDQVYYGYYLDL